MGYSFQRILLSSAVIFSANFAIAQTIIKGEIKDFANNQDLGNVNVRNIFTMKGMTTKVDGKFEIVVKNGELVEFSKVGYQTLRVRIQNVHEVTYYNLVMSRTAIQLREVDIKGKPLDFKKDSVKFHEMYDFVLRKPKKEEYNMQTMPLAMLSKKNREAWAFQEMYEKWEQDKFIDFAFNEKLVRKITYLENEELHTFMQQYRPSYEFLRSATQYEYLDYIKFSYYQFMKIKKENTAHD
jgi:hypothetical protein